MFKRNMKSKIQRALERSPAILLTGARQTGKTTLIKHLETKNNYQYISFDDVRFLSAAQKDPIGFIEELKMPVILDEVQRVPELFLTIKYQIDKNRQPGMFALTGSANPLLIPRLGDSLAGRMEIFTLYPLSQGELINKQETFIDTLFKGEIPLPTQTLSRTELYKKITIGGFPDVQNFDHEGRESWFNSYITTILQRDVRDLAQIAALAELPNLLHLLATRASMLCNVAELARASGISTTTLHRYLTLLETLFIIQFQLPWSNNLGKRFVKSPKLYIIDTGLLSFLLGVQLENAVSEGTITGAILENFIVSELNKQLTWCQTRARMFHFRTSSGDIEVDIVLEDAAGNIIGIEVKNNATVTSHDFRGLHYLQETVGKKFIRGIVLYTGSEYIPFGKQLCALPINSLWESQ